MKTNENIQRYSTTDDYLNPTDPIAAYRNNPLIGALGPILTRSEITALLTKRPNYDSTERDLPAHFRAHAVCSLRRLFVPTPTHEAIIQEVGLLLRQGYVHRNPLDRKYRKIIYSDRPALKSGNLPPPRFQTVPLLGSAALGTSGTGKTIGFDIALSEYPQLICHRYNFEGTPAAFKQVTWLKVNMFQDASLKAFAIEFFEKLGEATGEPLRKAWGIDQCNGNNVQPLIYQASREWNLGLLVVDELQNMVAHGKGFQAVLSYFVRMMNCLGLPIAVIGTNAATSLLRSDAPAARRFIGNIPAFKPFKRGLLWRGFLEEVWRYQYIKQAADLEKLEPLVHQLTGGVPDLVIKLYSLAQSRLFGRSDECLTENVLKETAADLFHTIKDRILEIKGQVNDISRDQSYYEKLNERYAQLFNHECTRAGATPAIPKIAPEPPVEIKSNSDETDNPLIAAGKSSDKKSALKKLGVLG